MDHRGHRKEWSSDTRYSTDRPENSILNERARHGGTDVVWLHVTEISRRHGRGDGRVGVTAWVSPQLVKMF